ncbi:MAG: hypothetical protein JXQ29_03250 [Planctomycetes bacterium]|nr:hypothetical protein [Planctomycetota bacterium]
MMKRILTPLLAVIGLLVLAAALASQAPRAPGAAAAADAMLARAADDGGPAGAEEAARSKAHADLGHAARTYEQVYERMSYGDRHLLEQLRTNQQRRAELEQSLVAKRAERGRLEERVADQLGRIRRIYPAGEDRDAAAELALEFEAARKSLEGEIARLEGDLGFARERIVAIEAELRAIRARSLSKGYGPAPARLAPAATEPAAVDAQWIADLERLRRRVVAQRVKRLADFRLQPFDPARCGRPDEFRTALFQAMK